MNCTATIIESTDYNMGGIEWFSVLECECASCTAFTSAEWLVRYGTEYTEDMSRDSVSVHDIDSTHMRYMNGAGAHLFHAEREPWNENDPYPDYVMDASGDYLTLMKA